MNFYFVYSSHRTREQAETALEDYFADGLICEGERPFIERRKGRYCVMFPG
jgi:hypothetical protein